MDRHIALLRSVNVGGHAKLGMETLRTLAEGLGFAEVHTVLQSGNLVFRSEDTGAVLEATLEAALAERLGLATTVMVRSAQDWDAIVRDNPFAAEAAHDPSHLLVYALKDACREGADAALRQAIRGPERVHVTPRHAYAVYPDGIGRSKLTTTVIESCLKTRCTGRNWNTVLKLAELVRV